MLFVWVLNISGIFWLRRPLASRGKWDLVTQLLQDEVPMLSGLFWSLLKKGIVAAVGWSSGIRRPSSSIANHAPCKS